MISHVMSEKEISVFTVATSQGTLRTNHTVSYKEKKVFPTYFKRHLSMLKLKVRTAGL